jgi:carbonic anhydrase/acetyltransferase-like protein (isoleucine patch superfamily)
VRLNDTHLGLAASVVASAVVHLGAIVAPRARIPAGWVAVGDPARVYPPGQAEAIRAGLAEGGRPASPAAIAGIGLARS